jgi:hypothetical protein
MPLPEASGEKRRTSQAASATAVAHAAVTSRKPMIGTPCDQAITASRQPSAWVSERRNSAPIAPAPAPTMQASSANTSRLPSHCLLSGITCSSGFIAPLFVTRMEFSEIRVSCRTESLTHASIPREPCHVFAHLFGLK